MNAPVSHASSSDAGAVRVVSMDAAEEEAVWERYVGAHQQATGYHAWPWRRVFKSAFGHDAVFLAAWQGDRLVGVLPMLYVKSPIFGRSLTSMAFLNYGGIVADSREAAVALREAARQTAIRLRCAHVELRHLARQFTDLPCRQHKVTMHLPLHGGMWGTLDRKVRNQIRKAQKSALGVERGGRELVGAFYEVFARNMRDLGTPVYSRRLFDEVLAQFPGRAAIHLVRLGERPVAAGVTFTTGRHVEVPWASSVRDFNALCPNHLLYWDIIESAVERGYELLDFGRSTPHEGTYKFKEQWGAQPVPLHWEYLVAEGHQLPDIAAGNPRFRWLVDLWKCLPLSIASAIGPRVVKGIP